MSSAPKPPRVTASCAVTHRVVLRTDSDDRLLVERKERPRVDDLDRDPVLLRLLGGGERVVHEPPGRDDGDVRPLAMDARLAERDRLELVRHLALHRIQRAVLEEHDGVVVVDRGPEEAPHVLGGRGEDDLEPGDVDEPGLELLGMLRARRPARAALRPDRERHLELATRHRAVLGCLVDQLLHGERQEVLVHDLDDGPHALHRGPDARSDDRDLGDRRVPHALGAELVEEPLRDRHRAAHLGDVLAHEEHVLVLAQRAGERVANGFPIRGLRHTRTSVRPRASGPCPPSRTRPTPRPRRRPPPRSPRARRRRARAARAGARSGPSSRARA